VEGIRVLGVVVVVVVVVEGVYLGQDQMMTRVEATYSLLIEALVGASQLELLWEALEWG